MAYSDKKTGEKVEIINEDINFYELDNGVRIKKEIFLKRYDEIAQVDPNSFFQPKSISNDPLVNLANQLKNIDTSKISDNSDGTKIKYVPPVVLADSSTPNTTIANTQTEEVIQLTPEQRKNMLEEWRKTQPGAQIPEVQEKNWDEDYRFNPEEKEKPINKAQEPKVDPMKMMFKMFKSNFPIKLNIEVEENIPNPTFISMIQENVEVDAVEYYANLISDKLLKDPTKLKSEIYNQLKKIIDNELETI